MNTNQTKGFRVQICRLLMVEVRTHISDRQTPEWTLKTDVGGETPVLRHKLGQTRSLIAAGAAVCLLSEPDLTSCLLSQPVTWDFD